MKLIKCIFLLMMMLIHVGLFAQDRNLPPAETRAQELTDWMTTNLGLNEVQASEVHDINLRYALKMDDVRTSTGSRYQKAEKVKSEAKAKDAELKAIFTKEQFATYESKKDELKQKAKAEWKSRKG